MSANDTCSTSNIFNNVPKLVVSKADSQSNAVEWKKWWQSFQMFLLATNLEAASEKRKIAILLHTVGEKGVEIYNSFNLDLEKITLSEVKNKFDNHFEPQKSLTMTRHSFFTRVQKDEETIDCFITDLQNKANKCEFGELKDSLIRDIFIANMSSKLINVKQRLLQENNPTLERTLTLAKTVIMAQENAQKIESTQCPDTVMHIQRQRPRSRSRGSSNKQSMSHSQVKSRQRSQSPFSQRSANNKTCGRCGQFHRFKCPAQGGLGCLPPVCRLKLQDNAVPCVDPPRKVPFGLYSKLKEELDRMSEMNVIEKVTHPTEWVNSVVVTVKKSGQLRICLDPRNLNKYIIREHYPLKSIDEIRSILKGASYFSHLDAFSGFWMLKLDSASSDLCTFQTPFGRYRYLRLPYGINAASEIFHRVMTEIFADLEGVLVFVDDILVYGETEEIHNKRLYKVMQRAREVNLKLNKDKCKFSVKEVCFLGYVFTKEGAKVDQEKVKAIVNMPTPTNVKELQRVLGMINYLGPFIQNMSEKTQVLRNLLKKDSVWVWDENCEKSFQSLKNAITNAPVLAHYNPNIPIVLSVDSSKKALGAVLMQNKQPIAYSSKTLTTTQERYAQIEKELFAIQFGCEKFHQYVYGNRVTVHTDHKPLVYLFKKPLHDVPARLQRMMLALQAYDLNVIHVPGKEMYISDTLSRAALKENYIPNYESDLSCHVNAVYSNLAISEEYKNKILQATKLDGQLQMLKKYCQNGWPTSKNQVDPLLKSYWNIQAEIHVINDLLFKNDRLIIPKSMQNEMLTKVHEGHQGINKCLSLARNIIFWPNMSADIKNLVDQCSICAKFKPNNQSEPLQSYNISKFPWQQVGIDLMHFNNKTYLVVTDYYSKFIELAMLNSKYTASNIIIQLKSIFARHGIPVSLVSDGGPPYNSAEFKSFLYNWDIEHKLTSPYHPKSNGQAESSVKIMKNLLKKCLESNKDPYMALLQYRNTPKANFPSPAQLLMSRNLRMHIPVTNKKLKPKVVTFSDYKKSFDKDRAQSRSYYNRNKKPLPLLQPGDHVTFKKNPNSDWLPAIVKERLKCQRSYIIEDSKGNRYRRNRVQIRFTSNESCHKFDSEVPSNASETQISQREEEPSERQVEADHDSFTDSFMDSVHKPKEFYKYVTRSGREIKLPMKYDL
ncbi:uncharacterized protein K02A2.6-like [Maniola jurtina]|uniref:uncharacterized protein K02A2.6-like n=1 Tax=Maniola jurtina TaxID=191418 RepID=UPI001E68AA0F|nr:uncharacterized protein K02A2.6-like [Maniola jurtina]